MTLVTLSLVIQAAIVGETIQFRPFSYAAYGPDFGWQDIPNVWAFDWSGSDYRIRPGI